MLPVNESRLLIANRRLADLLVLVVLLSMKIPCDVVFRGRVVVLREASKNDGRTGEGQDDQEDGAGGLLEGKSVRRLDSGLDRRCEALDGGVVSGAGDSSDESRKRGCW